MAQMAIDPIKFASFIREPKTAIRRAGLSNKAAAVLHKGDQNVLYDLLSSDS
jgi:hypothetical protein